MSTADTRDAGAAMASAPASNSNPTASSSSTPAPSTTTPVPASASISASASGTATPTPLPSGATTPAIEPTEAVLAKPAVRNVIAALNSHGLKGASLVRVLSAPGHTAATAAAVIGCSTGAIANSLIFTGADKTASGDKAPLLVLTSGGHRVDTRELGLRLGWSKGAIKRAKPEVVLAATGCEVGGVAPVGHPAPVRTIVDEAMREFDVVWAAAGHHQAVFPIAFDELVRVTGGVVMKVD